MSLTAVVQIAFASDPDDPTPTWTDVSAFADMGKGATITRGRTDEFSTVSPGVLALTLNNSDGRFTPGRTASPYYPNVQIGKRIRVGVTDGTTTWWRYDGRVDAWPVQWAPTGKYAEAPITAVDRSARFNIPLPNVIACEVGSDAPIAYYQLSEAAGAKTVVDSSTGVGNIGGVVGGSITFGSATGPGTDDETAGQFAAASLIECSVDLAAASPWTLAAWISTTVETSPDGTDVPFLYMVDDSGGIAYLGLGGLGSDQTVATLDPIGISSLSAGGGATINDGLTHHCAAVYDGAHLSVYLDGSLVQTSTLTSAGLDHVSRLYIGSWRQVDPYSGVIAHAALFNTALSATRISQHRLAGLNGFSGESASARIARLARYCKVDASEVSTETGRSTLTALDPTASSSTALDLMRAAELAEPGVLFISKTNVVTFQARRHRWNIANSVSLAAGQYSTDLKPVLDAFGLENDVRVTRGTDTTEYRASDAASIAANGYYPNSYDLIVNTDAQTRDRANWQVTVNGTPQVRWPQVTVDLLTQASLRSGVYGLDVGSRITLNGLPSSAPASSVSLITEGYTETIALDAFGITFNCSNYAPVGFLTLDNATLGAIDTNHLGL